MNRFQSWYKAQPKALRTLLTINVVIYIFWVLLLGRIEARTPQRRLIPPAGRLE